MRDIFVMSDVGIFACLHISADDVHFDPLKYPCKYISRRLSSSVAPS